ncbi:hypothetical protein AURDEDRAFT_173207 [Auricularia subglabra TFB-10046 SS5]|uniref:CNH domain-containing protein n=1 Tax=Auricularia subglabra (strain TFB-10046 / SS5) TaxID=717982 RepID=J0D0A3_AURST|nr:hypothetical protein AURDEDRAFT_173207 [Auricularia subglabra TFB-10046 SS5]
MAPFTVHAVLEGFKERVEAVCIQGDHLYVGTSTGNLHVYELDDHPGAHIFHLTNAAYADVGDADDQTRTVANLVEVKKAVTGRARAIERIAFLRDINSLVILCGTRFV